MNMKRSSETTAAPETSDFDPAAEHVLRKNQELYKRLSTEDETPPPSHDSDHEKAMNAFSRVRRQYRGTLKKLSR